MLLLNLLLVLAGSFFAWIHAIPLDKWMEFQVKCSYCFVWPVGSSSEQSENCLPGVLGSSLFTCSTLQTRPSFQPTPKSLSLHLQWVLTHAEYGQEEIEQAHLSTNIPLEGSLFLPTSSGSKVCLMGEAYLIGMCSVLVLGAIGGIWESLVTTFMLTDIWFLSSVRS